VIEAILIDTHIFIWARLRPERLSTGERRVLDDADLRYLSAAALWEVAVLQGLRRVEDDPKLLEVSAGFDLLPIRPHHCRALLELPQHHRDPFDRMLIAQARSEQVPLLTRDRTIAAYREHATILRHPEA
jgi:PIN domain nuclease of toxin-antitoxin system